MDKVTFRGLALPRSLRFRVASPLLNWYADEEGLIKIQCRCLIDRSQVTVDIFIDNFDLSIANQLYKRATDLSRTTLNLIALRDGMAVTIMLDKIVYPTGLSDNVTRTEPGASNIITAFDLTDNSQSLSNSLTSTIVDKELFMAIDDFVVGINHHHMSEANCRRAIERLRNAIAPGVTNKNTAYGIMNDRLNIDSASLRSLMSDTHANSHGEAIYRSGALVTPTLNGTLAVINRFIEYRNRGSKPLREPDFSLLVL